MARKRFTAEFKTNVVLTLFKEEKQIGELAAEHKISPNQLRNWRREIPRKCNNGVLTEQTRERAPS